MTEVQDELSDRVRALLADEPTTAEKRMFGTRCFLVRERILVCADKDGGLLVRVPADRHEELLDRPGAVQAEMGAGRTMGAGWITVSAAALEAHEDLLFWIDLAREHNGGL